MAAHEGLLMGFLLWISLLCSEGKELTITCVSSEDCVLPCRFQYDGVGTRVMWLHETGDVVFCKRYGNSSFINGPSKSPDRRFKERTILQKDRVQEGNATLVLQNITPKDQGRYRCYTMTTIQDQESFIHLVVKAPVRKVNIQLENSRLTCSSEGISPEPQLTWTISPPTSMNIQNTTTVLQTEEQLYNISSSLKLPAGVPDLIYACTVSTGESRKTAILMKPESINAPDTGATIPCRVGNASLSGFSLVWRFNRSQTIVSVSRAVVSAHAVSERWRQQVKDVSESGSLTLQGLSSHQEGIYTCELSHDDDTYVADITLRIESRPGPCVDSIIIGLLVAALLITILLAGVCIKLKVKTPFLPQLQTAPMLLSAYFI